MSQSRNPKYYREGDPLPKYLQEKVNAGLTTYAPLNSKSKTIVLWVNGERAIKNTKSVGTPRYQPINSQLIWQGDEWYRMKLRNTLHDYFVPGIERQLPETIIIPNGLFIHLEYVFYYPLQDKVASQIQDILNHAYVRMKTFEDALVTCNRIPNDNVRYVRGAYCRYVDFHTRLLEIRIHFCKNNQTLINV
jgi:hypothetical protein